MIILGTFSGIYMFWGKETFVNILERELPKERKVYMLTGGSGKDCLLSTYCDSDNRYSIIYCDLFKIVRFKLPPSVHFGNSLARKVGHEENRSEKHALLQSRTEI